jgi:hypothetical protein
MKIGVASADTNAASDLALVTGIRSGDQGAMAALYDRFSSIVYAVALRVLQDTGAAEDVTLEPESGSREAPRGTPVSWAWASDEASLRLFCRELSGARRRNRTVTELSPLGILSPVRLPVSPSGRCC